MHTTPTHVFEKRWSFKGVIEMPPKKRKFDSTFPAARIKKIMQLDDDVGRVASSVPIVISRAVEIFLQALLTRASGYATLRNAKTLTVGHIKHCIENEKQWDFLKDLTAKIPDISASNEGEGSPKRGRKRKNSTSKVSEVPTKCKSKKTEKSETNNDSAEDNDEETDSSSPGSSISHPSLGKHITEPSPLAMLQKRLSNTVTTPSSDQPTVSSRVSLVSKEPPSLSSPLLALVNSLNKPVPTLQMSSITSLGGQTNDDDDDDDDYD